MRISILILVLIPFLSRAQDIPDGYYDGTADLEGSELKDVLHRIIRAHRVYSYDDIRQIILDVDEDPSNPDNILLFYTNRSQEKSQFGTDPDDWNREHTWPSSHGFPNQDDTTYTDAHNLRPADASVNSSKSNKDFANLDHTSENEQGEAQDTFTDNDFWEPRNDIKGDVARILFYMDTRYNSLFDLSIVDRESFNPDPEIGVLYDLLGWHELDPVSEEEIRRHELIYGYQENRNPFIDHPEWVGKIWGNTTDPLITTNQLNFNPDFGAVQLGSSLVQSYDINGYQLNGDITITTSGSFSLSLDNVDFESSISVSEGTTQVFVKYQPQSEGERVDEGILHETIDGASVTIEVAGQEGTLSVETINEARTKSTGATVFVSGTVIGGPFNSLSNRIIYDGTAGIVVRSFDDGNLSSELEIGDSVLVRGNLGSYNRLLQISESPIIITKIKSGAKLPDPQLLTFAEVGEEHESELVRFENVRFISGGQFQGGGADGNKNMFDSSNNTFIFRLGDEDHPLVGTSVPLVVFNMNGIVGQFQADYQISPRDVDDIELLPLSVEVKVLDVYPNPAVDYLYVSQDGLSAAFYSLSGQLVDHLPIIDGRIDVRSLISGLYILIITDGSQKAVGKVMIR